MEKLGTQVKILEPEMVPIQFWRRRSHPLTSKGWGEVRKTELARTGNKCEYCGEVKTKGMIIHHEYDYVEELVQNGWTLRRYVSGYAVSCSKCNYVLHWQFSNGTGRGTFALQWLMKVRGFTEEQAWKLVSEKVQLWVKRCNMTPLYGDADRFLFRSDNVYVDTQTGLEIR